MYNSIIPNKEEGEKMNKIKFFRMNSKMTVRDLAKASSVSVGYLSDLENDSKGEHNPTKGVMARIAEALGETITNVFFSDEKIR